MRAQGASKLNMSPPAPVVAEGAAPRQVVYMPSCVTRMMGPAASDTERASVHDKLLSLFAKAGYEVIYPEVRAALLRRRPPCAAAPLGFRAPSMGASRRGMQRDHPAVGLHACCQSCKLVR